MDLPVHSVFPEDEAGLAELARQLEEQQKEANAAQGIKPETDSNCNRTDRASSSELDHSDFEDYRKTAFGGRGTATALSMSPQSLTYSDFDLASSTPSDSYPSQPQRPPMPTSFSSWMSRPQSMPDFTTQPFLASAPTFLDVDMLNQGMLESNFGTIKPHVLSCPNPEVMMGMGDPMIYSGYDADALRL